jgi:hypothetical protein
MRTLQKSPISIGLLGAAGLALCLIACQPAGEPAAKADPWTGKWIAIQGISTADGELAIGGVYHYYANGTFASQIAFDEREALEADPSTPEEYKMLFDTYRAGYGTYTVNEPKDTLTYQYVSNMRTHRIASPTSFNFTVSGDTMIVRYEEFSLTFLRER